MVFAMIMVGFLTWPGEIPASVLNVAQGAFAPAAQATPPQVAPAAGPQVVQPAAPLGKDWT